VSECVMLGRLGTRVNEISVQSYAAPGDQFRLTPCQSIRYSPPHSRLPKGPRLGGCGADYPVFSNQFSGKSP
jgi:hypothetical protein